MCCDLFLFSFSGARGAQRQKQGAVAVVCGCVVPWGVLYHVDIGLQNMLTGALSVENFSLYKRG